MSVTAEQLHCKAVSEIVNAGVNFQGKLDKGELISTISEVVDVDGVLTLTNKAINTSALTLLGASVAIGEAVQFTAAGGVADTTYTIRCKVTTDAGQTRLELVKLLVVADS